MVIGPNPSASLKWPRNNHRLFVQFGAGTLAIDHAALDELPRSKRIERLRLRLVATGCLPPRNTFAADFQAWLHDYLADVTPATNQRLLREYGHWRLLPRLRQPRSNKPQTYSALSLVKSRIKGARGFLDWCTARGLTLRTATQDDLNEFVTATPALRPQMEPFVNWTTKNNKSRRLSCPSLRDRPPKPIATDDERWQLLRRLLHDCDLDLADRVAGALILLYAQPLSRVLKIRRSDVKLEASDGADSADARVVTLQFGETPIELPAPLSQLIAELAARDSGSQTSLLTKPADWLFPGTREGQHFSEPRMKTRLRMIGLKAGPARSRAMIHLAQRVDAPVLARTLDISYTSATRWSELAGRTYNGYVVRAAQPGRTSS